MAPKCSRLVSSLAWIVLTSIAGITAIALLSSRWGWPLYLELLSHFQRQYWWLTFWGTVAISFTRRWRPFLLAIACVAALTSQLLPWYLPPHFLTMSQPGNFRVLISNVNTQNRNFAAVLDFAQQTNPDLALFIEVDDRWVEQLNILSVALPYFSGQANPYNSGIVVYSRHPFETVDLIDFAPDSTPSITATLTIRGQRLNLVGTHPLPPIKPSYFWSRNQQLEQLSRYLQTLEPPKVVIGDFNITMWSPYYRQFQRQTRLHNARDGFGIYPSWPTGKPYPPLPRWLTQLLAIPIDHCLVSPEITVANVQVGPNVGSDHRPVVVDLNL